MSGDSIAELRRKKKAAYNRRRRRLMAYGRWVEPFVDPAPAREHVSYLMRRYGISKDSVARLVGLAEGQVEQLTSPGHHQYPKLIRRETEARILAAGFDLDALDPLARVHAAGTQRRIHALARVGWNQTYLAERLGITVSAVDSYLKPSRVFVQAATARAIRDLYESHAMKLGPSKKTATRAAKRGWPPPWAWDDETMDDVMTEPDLACLIRPTQRASEDTLEDVRWLLETNDPGMTPNQIADRLKVSKDAITRAFSRALDQRRATAYETALGEGRIGPLRRDEQEALDESLDEIVTLRERLYANTEATGKSINSKRIAS